MMFFFFFFYKKIKNAFCLDKRPGILYATVRISCK